MWLVFQGERQRDTQRGESLMKKQDKCRIARCRADSEITLPDGTGLCWEHWEARCNDKQKDGLNQAKKGLEGQAQAGQDTIYNEKPCSVVGKPESA